MGVFGRKNTATTEELQPTSDQDTRQISATQLAEVLARVDGDRPSDAFERGEGRISGARRISELRSDSSGVIQAARVPSPPSVEAAPVVLAPIVEESANLRVVTAHQNTRALTIALVLAVATFFVAVLLAYRY
jgi:hypothetical protein